MALRARFLALCLLVPAVAFVAPVAAGDSGTGLRIDSVALDPDPATADTPVTVETTVANPNASAGPVTLETVSLAVDGETVATERGLGVLSPGGTVTAPVTTSFADPGVEEVRLTATGTAADDTETTVARTRTVVVASGQPSVEITSEPAVEGAATNVSVTVGNPTATTLRGLVVSLGATGLDPARDQRVVPALGPGTSQTVSFTVRPAVAGEALAEATVGYRTGAGTTAEVTRRRPLSVAERDEAVDVRVAAVETDSGQSDSGAGLGVQVPDGIDVGGIAQQQQQPTPQGDVRVTVSNTGNVPAGNVVLTPRAGNDSLGPRPVATTIPPGSEEAVTLSLSRVPAAVRFEVTYEATGNRSTAVAEFDPLANRGDVAVTGVDIERSGDTLTITGDIGNPGQGAVSGVVVAVQENGSVSPAYPGRTFFLGELQGDSFAPFELTATTGQNATAVPVEVSYLVAGERRSQVVRLPLGTVGDSSGGGGFGFPTGLAAVVGLVLLGALAIAAVWRR